MHRKPITIALLATLFALGVACSRQAKITNLEPATVRNAEKQAGFDNISVDLDKVKGVVTLSGKLPSQNEKDRAAQVAQGVAGNLVVSNQISVEPPGAETQAREIASNIDDSIEKQFKALLIANHWDKEHISYKSKNGVLTIKGKVASTQQRADVEKVAATVPSVSQVVNELDVQRKTQND